jgi:glycosyltransferase involved in cell wall biosynthesis
MAAQLEPDLFHVHEPELLGPVIARAGTRPVIWDVHEAYLDVLKDRYWIPRGLRKLACIVWDRRERQLVRRCAGVIAATDLVARRYYELHQKVVVVANYPDMTFLEDRLPVERDYKRCVYTGVIAPNRGVRQILLALGLLKQKGVDVVFELAGDPITEEYLRALMDEANQLGIQDRVIYHGLLPKNQVMALQQNAGIGLVPHLPYGNNMMAWPVKMFEFMAMELPMVYSDLPTHREIATGSGIAVDPTKPEQIAEAIERLVKNPNMARQMGKAGRCAIQERFNWNRECIKLFDLYQSVLGMDANR